jgi:hypothetical protein
MARRARGELAGNLVVLRPKHESKCYGIVSRLEDFANPKR